MGLQVVCLIDEHALLAGALYRSSTVTTKSLMGLKVECLKGGHALLAGVL